MKRAVKGGVAAVMWASFQLQMQKLQVDLYKNEQSGTQLKIVIFID